MNTCRSNDVDRVFWKMLEFDAGDLRRIQHFCKVFQFASLIGAGEGLDDRTRQILELAAIVHDIGIIPAEQKFGRNDGKIQEQVGPDYAEALLREAEIDEDVIARVKFLVGHHHTYQGIDGPDWQILLEADYLVNACEEEIPTGAVKTAVERIFRTDTGIRLAETMYNIK